VRLLEDPFSVGIVGISLGSRPIAAVLMDPARRMVVIRLAFCQMLRPVFVSITVPQPAAFDPAIPLAVLEDR
jgi:hypothetical protein